MQTCNGLEARLAVATLLASTLSSRLKFRPISRFPSRNIAQHFAFEHSRLRFLTRKNHNCTTFLPFLPFPFPSFPFSSHLSPSHFFPPFIFLFTSHFLSSPFPLNFPILLSSTESSQEAWGSAVSSPDKCAVRTAQNRMKNAYFV